MINQTTISPEPAAANQAQQQGLHAKGKSGKDSSSKTVFLRLLEGLQHGSQNKKELGNQADQKNVTKTSVQVGEKQEQQTAKESLLGEKSVPVAKNAGLKGIAIKGDSETSVAKILNTETHTSDNKINAADAIAVVQETPLLAIQPQLTTKDSQHSQSVLADTLKNKGKTSKQTTPSQLTEHVAQQIIAEKNTRLSGTETVLKGSSLTNFTENEQKNIKTEASVNFAKTPASNILNLGIEAPKVSTQAIEASKTPSQTIETPKNTNPATLNDIKTKTPDLAAPVHRSEQANTSLSSSMVGSKDVEVSQQSKQGLNTQHTETQSNALLAQAAEKDRAEKSGAKSAQSPIAALQQRSPNQQTQLQNNQFTAQQGNQAVNMRMTEANTNTSQQDLNSNQQNVDLSLVDTQKSEAKGSKGIDFQAQLAYRSQRTFTPADTMLEIVKSAKTGSTSLELQLEPANLGKVQVSIQIDASKQIQVAFTVDQAASRQALEQQMPQLRLALAQQGLDLGGFSMQMNQQGGQQGQSESSAHLASTESAEQNLKTSENNQENQTRIGVNLATHGHLNILA